MIKSSDIHGIKLPDDDSPIKEPFFPIVKVRTVEEYFALPKNKREKFGVYLLPVALPSKMFSPEEVGWGSFEKRILKEYPVQAWIRNWLLSCNNPVYFFIKKIIWKISDLYYDAERFIRPLYPRFRKTHPRHKYIDGEELIADANLAIILDFWLEEVNVPDCFVDWHGSPEHLEFYNWLESAVLWISARKELLQKIEDAYSEASSSDKDLRGEKYEQINTIEAFIDERDSEVLKKMIDYRGYFWT